MQLRVETRGSGKNKQTWTVIAGFLRPGLDVGLGLQAQGFLSDAWGALFGATDIEVGDAQFDAAFSVKADEARRAQALLTPDVRRELQALHASGASLRVGDAGLSIEIRGACEDARWLTQGARAVARVTRLLDEARRAVPPAALLLPHREAWLTFAHAAGLQGMDSPLCMWGRMDGCDIAAYAVRSGPNAYGLEVLVRFEQPLGIALHVRPAGTLDALGALLGSQDESLGDVVLDKRYVVKTARPDRVPVLLDAPVRERLKELALGRDGDPLSVQIRTTA